MTANIFLRSSCRIFFRPSIMLCCCYTPNHLPSHSSCLFEHMYILKIHFTRFWFHSYHHNFQNIIMSIKRPCVCMETDFLWSLSLGGKLSVDVFLSLLFKLFGIILKTTKQNCNLKPEQGNISNWYDINIRGKKPLIVSLYHCLKDTTNNQSFSYAYHAMRSSVPTSLEYLP